jgi:hypothetical protein
MGAVKMPPSAAKDPIGRMQDRLFLLEEGTSHLERRWQAFLEERTQDADALEEKLRAWVKQGLTGEAAGVPWES